MRHFVSFWLFFLMSFSLFASDCIQTMFYKNMYSGMHYYDAQRRAVEECMMLYPPDPRPAAYLYLATKFMGVGIYRDQAIPRAYEIVYAPGGKGPKSYHEVDDRINGKMINGAKQFQAIWEIFENGE